jgi:pimeloyl-ACP methyl ester carboxylesterase
MGLDLHSLLAQLQQLQPLRGPVDSRPIIQDLLDTELPRFERDLKDLKENLDAQPPALLKARATMTLPDSGPPQAIIAGAQKYTHIPVPILAIYAEPHRAPPAFAIKDSAARAAADARDSARVETQAEAFAAANPSVRLVRLPHADHYVFLSNEADVLREVNAFLAGLPDSR